MLHRRRNKNTLNEQVIEEPNPSYNITPLLGPQDLVNEIQ